MEGLAVSITMVLIIGGGVASCFMGSSQKLGAVLSILVAILLSLFLPTITYNMAKVEYENNEMQVVLYQEQTKMLDETFPQIKDLNPNSVFLSNHDTPIQSAIDNKTRLIRQLTRVKENKYKAWITMQKIQSVFFWVGE